MIYKQTFRGTLVSSSLAMTALLFSFNAHALGDVSEHKSKEEKLTQYTHYNNEFVCTPSEVGTFMSATTTSLFSKVDIPTVKEHIQQQAVQNKDEEDNCLTLFEDLKVVEDIKKLIKAIQALSISMPTTDGMGEAAKALAKRMVEQATDAVCNALTKEAAKKLINEIMSRQLGYDIDDIQSMEPKEFALELAKEHAGAHLESKGIDSDWLDNEEHQDLMDGLVESEKDDLMEQSLK
ncbi:conserved exported hypothetical protein [Vibrio chagasii]|nr:conserved exported hypothetical protein [Vibrio chagasii]CAH7323267.1 conserved exported hypothetical protein [Vibrio chagasii]